MGDIGFLEAIGGYFALVLVFALFNLIYNVSQSKLKLTFGAIVAHLIASAIAEFVFIVVYALIFWIHKGAAWWIGCVVATVIGTGALRGILSSQRT